MQFLPKYVTTLSTTPSAYKLYLDLKEDDQDQYVLYLWYKEWSDDFNPNNTKASRSQVWSNTFTIGPPEGENEGRYSYFMSLSCKGEDHSEIEIESQKELDALSNEGEMFYHGGLKRIIKVKMGKLLLCVGHPERTSILQVGDHNGTFSTFWGHSCKVDGYCKENHLPSCKDCRKHRLHRIIAGKILESNETDMFPVSDGANYIPVECNARKNTIQACNGRKCASWDVLHPSFKFCVPANYPTNYDQWPNAPLPPNGREINLPIEGTKRMLCAICLDVKWMQSAIIFGHHNVKTRPPGGRTNKRFWTKANLSSYLDDCMKHKQNENQTSRQIEGAVKVYGSRQMAEEAIYSAEPITAVLDHKNVLYIPYRPIGRANTTRSSVDLMEIKCDDNEGTMIQNLCWVCPIHSTNNITPFESIYLIKSNFIKEFVLMLPTLNEDNGQDFMNNYYCVGHTWTERNEEGKFLPTPINKNIFSDCYEDDDDENNDEYMI